MLVFSANSKDSPPVTAFFHAELPVKLVAFDVLDGGHASAFGLSKVEYVQAVANLHGGERILEALCSNLGKRCSIEREHVGSVFWFRGREVDR